MFNQQGGGGGGGGGPVQQINEKLRTFGIPTLTVRGHVVEPIFLVGGLLALMMWGFPGLLIALIIWYMNTRQ